MTYGIIIYYYILYYYILLYYTIIISYTILFSSLLSSSHPSIFFLLSPPSQPSFPLLSSLLFYSLFPIFSHLISSSNPNPLQSSSDLSLLFFCSNHLIHSILVGTYIYLFIFYQYPTIPPRMFYRSGWLRCDVFNSWRFWLCWESCFMF